jgi:SAM-dependent methyltransferase
VSGRYIRLRELVLGFEGLALLRGLVDASDDEMSARVAEIRDVVARMDDEPYATGMDVREADARAGYADWSSTYDAGGNPLILVEQPVVERLTGSLPPGDALDAACGTGRHSKHLVRRHKTRGVDQSPEMLAVARATVPDAVFEEGDLTELPLRDASFDVVVCALALCHLTDVAAGVRELARVARSGARLIFTDPHPLGELFINQAFFPTPEGGLGFVRNHYHSFGTYLDAFANADLSVVRCHEPLFAEEHIVGLLAQFVPGAARQALVGMPFAIVWELEKN